MSRPACQLAATRPNRLALLHHATGKRVATVIQSLHYLTTRSMEVSGA